MSLNDKIKKIDSKALDWDINIKNKLIIIFLF